MEFWNSLLTEKSWQELQHLCTLDFTFVVIGGWAAYLWTKLHKSKDIDIVLSSVAELENVRRMYDVSKNTHLKKYEVKREEFDIDIYVPYFSKLPIPVEDIPLYATKVEGIPVVIPEALIILKQGAEIDRRDSVKGQKDRLDIMALLCYAPIDFKTYYQLLKKYKLPYDKRLHDIVQSFSEYRYLNLTPRLLKIKKEEIVKKMKNVVWSF